MTDEATNDLITSTKETNDWEMIYKAAFFGNYLELQNELNQGIDPNSKTDITSTAYYPLKNNLLRQKKLTIRFNNITPLYLAALKGKKKCVKLLMERGADPKIKTTNTYYNKSFTPLQVAFNFCHFKSYKLMKKKYSNNGLLTYNETN